MKDLEGKVALIAFGEGLENTLRATALALAARGVCIVVTGTAEKVLGETVGEIAYQGGKARHVVGDVAAAVGRAIELFGGLDIVIANHAQADAVFEIAVPKARAGGRLLVLATAAGESRSTNGGANVIVKEAIAEPEDVASLAAFLCSSAARAVNGQTITVGRAG